MNNQYGFYAQD